MREAWIFLGYRMKCESQLNPRLSEAHNAGSVPPQREALPDRAACLMRLHGTAMLCC